MSARLITTRHNSVVLKKLAKLPHKIRKKYIKDWPCSAFKDIKNISSAICNCRKIPQKTFKKLKTHRNIIRKISKSKPATVKNILVNHKGGAVFAALAGALIPIIIDQIVKATA